MKKIPAWIWIVIVFGVLIGLKFIFLSKSDQKGGPQSKKGKDQGPVKVNYIVAHNENFSLDVYTTGKIGAMNEVEIRPEVSGKVVAVYFREGELIQKGSPIVKINDADLQAQLMKNKVQLKLAEEKLTRIKKLLAVNGVSQEEHDVQANEVEALKADQQFITAQLAKTNIVAPFTGSAGLKNISEGAYVSPAQSIVTLVQLDPLFIEFAVPERYAALLKKGLKLKFHSDKEGKKMQDATVFAVEPKIDEATRTIRARALYSGKDVFYPGAFVKVYIDINDSGNTIMIPTQCVIPVMKGQKVWVARNGGAEEVKVITGVRKEDKIQIIEGLKEGDTVLTTGIMSVKKDSKIKLQSAVK